MSSAFSAVKTPARLHRYEMGLERSLYRALKELQAMRLRQSDKTNPPA